MNKLTIISLIVICLGLLFFIFSSLFSAQNPRSDKKTVSAPSVTPPASCSAVTVLSPKPNQSITTPLNVQIVVDNRGMDCHWTVFEGQAGTMELKDEQGNVLGKGILSTTENWMTTDPVRFIGDISATIPKNISRITLYLYEENPGGNTDTATITIPLKN